MEVIYMETVNIEILFSNEGSLEKMLFENVPKEESIKFKVWYTDRGNFKDKKFYFSGENKMVTGENIIAYNIINL